MNSKERCLATIRGEYRDRTPVFPLLMFFAQSRYGITYREYATCGESLAGSQLHIRERFGVDAITSCSDAFRITADLGADMVYPEAKPPFASAPLVQNRSDLDRLRRPDVCASGNRTADRIAATRAMVEGAGGDCLVCGWVDMPFAEACSICGVTEFLMILVDAPALAHAVLDWVTDIVIDFALAQLETGAPMIGAGDAAASLISPAMYREFALPYEKRVTEAIHAADGLMKLHICGNTTSLLEDMTSIGADLYNVDHLVPFAQACRVYGEADVAFKGNLDPVGDFLQISPSECADRALRCLREAAGTRYMLSAGCEIPAAAPDEVFEAFCEVPARA